MRSRRWRNDSLERHPRPSKSFTPFFLMVSPSPCLFLSMSLSLSLPVSVSLCLPYLLRVCSFSQTIDPPLTRSWKWNSLLSPLCSYWMCVVLFEWSYLPNSELTHNTSPRGLRGAGHGHWRVARVHQDSHRKSVPVSPNPVVNVRHTSRVTLYSALPRFFFSHPSSSMLFWSCGLKSQNGVFPIVT